MKAVLVISDRDNVGTALEPLEPGRRVAIDGGEITVAERVAAGHKIAIAPIAQGAGVLKYGSPIGTATIDIAPGEHVHTHNVASGRGRGDLGESSISTEPRGRIAEPPDETQVPGADPGDAALNGSFLEGSVDGQSIAGK